MEKYVTIPHGTEARQLNGHSLVLTSKVAWVPCDADREFLLPSCWRQPKNTRLYSVYVKVPAQGKILKFYFPNFSLNYVS